MSKKYFKCKPDELCNGVECCNAIYSSPALGISDFIRLSEYTGESIVDIWLTKGDMCLMPLVQLSGDVLGISLGLFHEPCPYLGEEKNCSVYPSRPSECAMFPIGLLSHGDISDCYKSCKCIQGIAINKRQRSLFQENQHLLQEEMDATQQYFWNGAAIAMIPITKPDHARILDSARQARYRMDPQSCTTRSIQINKTLDQYEVFVNRPSGLTMDINELLNMLRACFYSCFQEEIAIKLERLSEPAMTRFRDIAERMDKLVGRSKII